MGRNVDAFDRHFVGWMVKIAVIALLFYVVAKKIGLLGLG